MTSHFSFWEIFIGFLKEYDTMHFIWVFAAYQRPHLQAYRMKIVLQSYVDSSKTHRTSYNIMNY